MTLFVPMEVQPPSGWDGKRYVADEIRTEGQWLNVVECGHPVLKRPHKPGDVVKMPEVWASPSKYIVAYDSDGECGAWVGDGAGGRLWIHHGYILESTGYKRFTQEDENIRTWGLRKYGGEWQPASTMPAWAMRSHRILTPGVPVLRDAWVWEFETEVVS